MGSGSRRTPLQLMAIILLVRPSISLISHVTRINYVNVPSPFSTRAFRPQTFLSPRKVLLSRSASKSGFNRRNLRSSISSTIILSLASDLQTRNDLGAPESITRVKNNTKQSKPPFIELNLSPDACDSLDGRLLCASQCAYNISEPYFRGAAYHPGTVAKRISRGVNSVFIGLTFDGIVVAFRGTQTSNPLDWIQNAALLLIPVNDEKGFKGKIHTGFFRATKSLWKPMKDILKQMVQICDEKGLKKDIILTGHSKGGAMASLLALLVKRDSDLPDPAYVCSFASAKVGDSEFRDHYNKNINQTSYEAHLDIIPFLPPSKSIMENMNVDLTEIIEGMLWSEASSNKKNSYKWDYQTVGKRKFINEYGQVLEDVTKELDAQRIRDIEKRTFLSLDDFRAAHCSFCPDDGCYGYYFKAVAEGTCGLCEDDDEYE